MIVEQSEPVANSESMVAETHVWTEILELIVRSQKKCYTLERRVTLSLKYDEDNNDGVHNFLETGLLNLIESSNMYRNC